MRQWRSGFPSLLRQLLEDRIIVAAPEPDSVMVRDRWLRMELSLSPAHIPEKAIDGAVLGPSGSPGRPSPGCGAAHRSTRPRGQRPARGAAPARAARGPESSERTSAPRPVRTPGSRRNERPPSLLREADQAQSDVSYEGGFFTLSVESAVADNGSDTGQAMEVDRSLRRARLKM